MTVARMLAGLSIALTVVGAVTLISAKCSNVLHLDFEPAGILGLLALCLSAVSAILSRSIASARGTRIMLYYLASSFLPGVAVVYGVVFVHGAVVPADDACHWINRVFMASSATAS